MVPGSSPLTSTVRESIPIRTEHKRHAAATTYFSDNQKTHTPELKRLSEEQAQVLEAIEEGGNVFFTGPAGSGKSMILRHIEEYLSKKGRAYQVTATTGVAALNVGGTTINSWAGLGVGDKPVWFYSGTQTFENKLEIFRETDVLIIDEISMVRLGMTVN